MTTNTSEESGLEELHRLSREIRDMEKELNQDLGRAKEKIALAGKKHAIWKLVKDIKVSLVLDKLKNVAPPEITERFDSFKDSHDTNDLRKLILGIVDELENRVESKDLDNPSTASLIKTLGILTEFLFYVEY